MSRFIMPNKRQGFDLEKVEAWILTPAESGMQASLAITMASGATITLTGKEAKLMADVLEASALRAHE